jgi:hypothetical protein
LSDQRRERVLITLFDEATEQAAVRCLFIAVTHYDVAYHLRNSTLSGRHSSTHALGTIRPLVYPLIPARRETTVFFPRKPGKGDSVGFGVR